MAKLGLWAAAVLAVGLFVSTAASAQKVIVDGEMWMRSSPEIRKAFLIGAGNMVALEKAYAKKKGIALPPASAKLEASVQAMSLDQISDRVTQYYKAHPDQQHVPVMGVIWVDIVKPAVAATP